MHIVISLMLQFVFWFLEFVNLGIGTGCFFDFCLPLCLENIFGAINIIKQCSKINKKR